MICGGGGGDDGDNDDEFFDVVILEFGLCNGGGKDKQSSMNNQK